MSTWIKVSSLPEMTRDSDCEQYSSAAVLVYMTTGEINTAKVTSWKDNDSVPAWISYDSEGWAITKYVTHWMPLPDAPTKD